MPRDEQAKQGSPHGIPKAVREGAEAARGDLLELGEPARDPQVEAPVTPIETAARTVMSGAVRAQGGAAGGIDLVQRIAAELIRGAREADASIAEAARGAVAGALDASRETRMDRTRVAEAAAAGALEAAAELGEASVEHVKKVVTDVVGDLRPIDESSFGKGRRTP